MPYSPRSKFGAVYLASDTVLASSTVASAATTSTTFVKLKAAEFVQDIYNAGSVRVKWSVSGFATAHSMVYISGVATGVDNAGTGAKVNDVSYTGLHVDDTIEVWARDTNGLATQITNFYVCGDLSPMTITVA